MTLIPVNAPYWPVWVGRVPMLRSGARLLPYLMALWRAAGQTDVFHVMANSGWAWHLFAAPAIWIARFRGTAVVVNYRGGEAAGFLQGSERLVSFTMRQASALVVPSGFLHEVFARFGMSAEVVPNIIDLSRFHARSCARSGAPHLLVARNLEPLYDNETAIRALEIVRVNFADARLTIAGSGPEEERLRRLVKARGLERHVDFAGRLERDEMAAMYRSADVMINPSLADNMPNSLLEAWASGVPVVSTHVGGIPFMAKDGLNASLVAAGDPQSMARECCVLLSDNALWIRRAQAGQIEAQRYTWQRVKPVLAGVYQRALARTAA